MATRVRIAEETLRELYVAQQLTLAQIATRCDVSEITVRRRLSELAIPIRSRGRLPKRLRDRPELENHSPEWTADLAYVVGLIATDGCLSRDGRHLVLTSKDVDLLETVRRCLGITARATATSNEPPGSCHRLQWSDCVFYRWLIDIGLTPAKSLTLGPVAVPDPCFRDFLRGCIDGDGSITTYTDRYNTFKKPTYVYTRLFVKLVSASPRFLHWVRATVQRLIGLTGSLTVQRVELRNDLWVLKYAKGESLTLLRWLYYEWDLPSLGRKRDIAACFLARRDPPPRRGPGRPMVV